jgi:quercetin 2,3-dioxygenase
MMHVITADERRLAATDAVKSFNLLSGTEPGAPQLRFGPLLVFNDVLLAPKGEVPVQSRTDLEVVSIVLSGTVTHTDSLGNEVEVGKGGAFRISTGLGMSHGLINHSKKDEVHLLQLGFEANSQGLSPSFEQKDLDFLDAKNELFPVATGQRVLEDVLFINSNSTVYYSGLAHDKNIDFNTFRIRKTLFYLLEGTLFVNGVEAAKHDQIQLEEQEFLNIRASADARFVMVDVPAFCHWGNRGYNVCLRPLFCSLRYPSSGSK